VRKKGASQEVSTQLHPTFNRANGVWYDVLSISGTKIDWVSAE
jgi:hypothetical protein